MNCTTEVHSEALEKQGQNQNVTQQHRANRDAPRLIACLLLLPEDAEVLAGLLRNLATNLDASQNIDVLARPDLFQKPEASDSWLPHVEAAKSLGVSKSTLYRYACQQKIEARKLGGRLEYRRSTLDKYKDQQIRPAQRSRTRGIIAPALGSGK
jgi:excisionase family DNA binding protein